jgi:hypothetical protein
LDVHKKTVVACRTKPGSSGEKRREVRTFGPTPPDLLGLVDWLHEWGCTPVAPGTVPRVGRELLR